MDAADWVVSLLGFAHPPVTSYSLIGQISAPFVFAANMFGFVLAVRARYTLRARALRTEWIVQTTATHCTWDGGCWN